MKWGPYKVLICLFMISVVILYVEYKFENAWKSLKNKFELCFKKNSFPLFQEYKVKVKRIPTKTLQELEDGYTWIQNGGHWVPENCISPTRIAVIIPYRNRKRQLDALLTHLHPFLRMQRLDYTIIVVEQYGNATFNKGKLMNAAFLESRKIRDFDCYIFHDVDLLPEDYRNMYVCDEFPKHMAVLVDTLGYKLPYSFMFGGVVAFTPGQFKRVDGFSNLFWGWGGEDDEMGHRITFHFGRFVRPNATFARYTMVRHAKEIVNPLRNKIIKMESIRNHSEGLSTLRYKVISTASNKLYTWYLVRVTSEGRVHNVTVTGV